MLIRCFISYRREDRQADFARVLATRLSKYKNIEAWIDVNQFQIGLSLHNWIEQGIRRQSDIFVPILSPEYLKGTTCQKELKFAVKLGDKERKPILPIVLADCELPLVLGDLTWGDFRHVVEGSGRINRQAFTKALRILVKSIRFHGGDLGARQRRITFSAVSSPHDLCTHLYTQNQ